MSHAKLSELLQQLKDEIRTAHELDEQGSELVDKVSDDVGGWLDEGEAGTVLSPHSIEEAECYFEQMHPTAASILRQMMVTLANMGI